MRFLAVLTMVLFGCAQDRVEVQCQSVGDTITCSVSHTTGNHDVDACFDAVVQCRNGNTATAHACQSLTPEQMASKTLRDEDFKGMANCDSPNGFTVANLKIEKR